MNKINKCGCGNIPAIKGHGSALWISCPCGIDTKIFSSLDKLMKIWNTAHPETQATKLSNAVQAVMWLESGQKIKDRSSITGFTYEAAKHDDGIDLISNGRTSSTMVMSHFLAVGQEGNWELYEEPKCRQISYEEAISLFIKFKKVCAVINDNEHKLVSVSHKELVFDSVTIYHTDTQFSNLITQENKWRVYE